MKAVECFLKVDKDPIQWASSFTCVLQDQSENENLVGATSSFTQDGIFCVKYGVYGCCFTLEDDVAQGLAPEEQQCDASPAVAVSKCKVFMQCKILICMLLNYNCSACCVVHCPLQCSPPPSPIRWKTVPCCIKCRALHFSWHHKTVTLADLTNCPLFILVVKPKCGLSCGACALWSSHLSWPENLLRCWSFL